GCEGQDDAMIGKLSTDRTPVEDRARKHRHPLASSRRIVEEYPRSTSSLPNEIRHAPAGHVLPVQREVAGADEAGVPLLVPQLEQERHLEATRREAQRVDARFDGQRAT